MATHKAHTLAAERVITAEKTAKKKVAHLHDSNAPMTAAEATHGAALDAVGSEASGTRHIAHGAGGI